MNFTVKALVSGLLCALPALAAPPPIIAIHPLIMIGGLETENTKLHQLLMQELSDHQFERVKQEVVFAALARDSNGSCKLNFKCYGRLATTTGATATLVVIVKPYLDRPLITARLIAPNGGVFKAGKSEIQSATPGEMPATSLLRTHLHDAIEQLQLATFAPSTTPPAARPDVTDQSPQPPPVAPVVTIAPQTPPANQPAAIQPPGLWSYVAGGAGVLCLMAGVGVHVAAEGTGTELQSRLNPNGYYSASDTQAVQLRTTLNQEVTARNILFIGAAVGVVAGVVIWAVPKPVQVSIAPGPSGASIAVAGRF